MPGIKLSYQPCGTLAHGCSRADDLSGQAAGSKAHTLGGVWCCWGLPPPDAPVREQQHVAMHVHVVMAGAYASVVLQHLVRTRVCTCRGSFG